MPELRSVTGAVVGAGLAGLALRVRRVAQARGTSVVDVLGDLPALLTDDAGRIREAARGALVDGKRAAARKEAEVQQVLDAQRRTTEGT